MKKVHAITLVALLCAGAAHAGAYFTSLTSHYPADIVTQANAALDAIEDRIDGTSEVTSLTVGGAVTVISTNDAVTNVIVTVDGVIDGETIKDDTIDDDSIDFADVTGADLTLTDCTAITASGNITANGNIVGDNDTIISGVSNVTLVAGSTLAAATVTASGTATLSAALVLAPGTIANGAGVFTQTVANASYVLEPSAVHTQTFAAATAGTVVFIKNNAATNVVIDVGAGDVTLGDNDCVTLGYLGGEWITLSTKDN